MTPTSTMRVGPYTLKIMWLYSGPRPEVEDGTDAQALAQLLSHALGIPEHRIVEAIEEGREGGNMVTSVSPAIEADDCSLRDEWAALTGEELGSGEVARVEVMGRDDRLVVSWTVLRKALAELQQMNADWVPEPGPWLFVRPAKSLFPAPEDLEIVMKLEEELAAIDELKLNTQTGQEAIELLQQRRRFLERCQDVGIFDNHPQTRSGWIASWGYSVFQLHLAGTQLREWKLLEADQEPLDGPVCLDYVRHKQWPPDDDDNVGLRWASAAIQQIADETGDQGTIIESVGGVVTTVSWRRDGDRPALLRISRE